MSKVPRNCKVSGDLCITGEQYITYYEATNNNHWLWMKLPPHSHQS